MAYIVSKKDGKKNIVIFPFAALFYWLMWPTIAASFIAWQFKNSIVTIASVVMWVLLIGMAVPYWPTVFRIRRIMKETAITAKGSKYSFTNPIRYEWED